MSACSVREGGAADIPAMMKVMHAAFDPAHGEAWSAPQCASALSIPGTIMLVAERNGQIAGFALVRALLDAAELLLIATRPQAQQSGIGSALLDQIVKKLAAAGVTRLFLEMRDNNDAAQFYARRGFIKIGRRRDYYRGGDGRLTDAVTMSRTLSVTDQSAVAEASRPV